MSVEIVPPGTGERLAPRPLLETEWRDLVMLNFAVPPSTLAPYLPCGTELDTFAGRALISLVGFRFVDARIWGLGVPGYRDFPEVNLRFYVKRCTVDGWQRGLSFIRELVPRRAVAFVANRYGEHFLRVPMQVERDDAMIRYAWRYRGEQHCLWAEVAGPPALPPVGSEEEFIVEHYVAFSRLDAQRTRRYRVEHPPWRLRPVVGAGYRGDAASLYGAALGRALSAEPTSCLVATGSVVRVFAEGSLVAGC